MDELTSTRTQQMKFFITMKAEGEEWCPVKLKQHSNALLLL